MAVCSQPQTRAGYLAVARVAAWRTARIVRRVGGATRRRWRAANKFRAARLRSSSTSGLASVSPASTEEDLGEDGHAGVVVQWDGAAGGQNEVPIEGQHRNNVVVRDGRLVGISSSTPSLGREVHGFGGAVRVASNYEIEHTLESGPGRPTWRAGTTPAETLLIQPKRPDSILCASSGRLSSMARRLLSTTSCPAPRTRRERARPDERRWTTLQSAAAPRIREGCSPAPGRPQLTRVDVRPRGELLDRDGAHCSGCESGRPEAEGQLKSRGSIEGEGSACGAPSWCHEGPQEQPASSTQEARQEAL